MNSLNKTATQHFSPVEASYRFRTAMNILLAGLYEGDAVIDDNSSIFIQNLNEKSNFAKCREVMKCLSDLSDDALLRAQRGALNIDSNWTFDTFARSTEMVDSGVVKRKYMSNNIMPLGIMRRDVEDCSINGVKSLNRFLIYSGLAQCSPLKLIMQSALICIPQIDLLYVTRAVYYNQIIDEERRKGTANNESAPGFQYTKRDIVITDFCDHIKLESNLASALMVAGSYLLTFCEYEKCITLDKFRSAIRADSEMHCVVRNFANSCEHLGSVINNYRNSVERLIESFLACEEVGGFTEKYSFVAHRRLDIDCINLYHDGLLRVLAFAESVFDLFMTSIKSL